MKTSFNKLIETERFLLGEMQPQDALVFEAGLLVDKELKTRTRWHRMVHRLVLLYSRKSKKVEMEAFHSNLFSDPEKSMFRENVLEIFKK